MLMWLLVRIDDGWDLVIIGGYDTQQKCLVERDRSLWGTRVFCTPAKTRTISWREETSQRLRESGLEWSS